MSIFIFFVFLSIIFLIFIVFQLRKVKKNRLWKDIEKSWKIVAKKVVKEETLTDHVLGVLLSLCVGITFFIILNTYLLPKSLPLPKTTAINWLTLHNHSLTLDYIRFALFSLIVPGVTVFGWIVWVLRKNH